MEIIQRSTDKVETFLCQAFCYVRDRLAGPQVYEESPVSISRLTTVLCYHILGFWGSKLRSSCLHGKCFNGLSHCPSSISTVLQSTDCGLRTVHGDSAITTVLLQILLISKPDLCRWLSTAFLLLHPRGLFPIVSCVHLGALEVCPSTLHGPQLRLASLRAQPGCRDIS